MNTKHTPGPSHTPAPWIADEMQDANGFTTIREDDGSESGNLYTQPIATVYDDTNARLIAAAPELLEALSRILKSHDPAETTEEMEEDRDLARAAIAKATNTTKH